MPPTGKGRKKAKRDASGGIRGTSEVVTDYVIGPPPPKSRVRHTESEVDSSSSEMDIVLEKLGSKRFKSGRAAVAATAAAAATNALDEVVVSDHDGPKSLATFVAAASASVSPAAVPRESRAGRRMAAAGGVTTKAQTCPCVGVADLRKVTDSFYDIVFGACLEAEVTRKVVDYDGKYEELLMKLVVENERLRRRLDVYQSTEFGHIMSSARLPAVKPSNVAAPARVAAAVPAAVAPVKVLVAVSKPVEIWTVVVRGKGGAAASKEVVNKVVGQVGPTLGVRVHELKEIRRGGTVIRTPSLAEREKIAANRKFEEVGLEVTVNDKLGPRVVASGVHSEISPDEFMSELFEMNRN